MVLSASALVPAQEQQLLEAAQPQQAWVAVLAPLGSALAAQLGALVPAHQRRPAAALHPYPLEPVLVLQQGWVVAGLVPAGLLLLLLELRRLVPPSPRGLVHPAQQQQQVHPAVLPLVAQQHQQAVHWAQPALVHLVARHLVVQRCLVQQLPQLSPLLVLQALAPPAHMPLVHLVLQALVPPVRQRLVHPVQQVAPRMHLHSVVVGLERLQLGGRLLLPLVGLVLRHSLGLLGLLRGPTSALHLVVRLGAGGGWRLAEGQRVREAPHNWCKVPSGAWRLSVN